MTKLTTFGQFALYENMQTIWAVESEIQKSNEFFADPTRCQWLYPPCALRQKVATLFSVSYAETFFTQPYNGFLEMKIVTPVKVDSWPRKVNV